MWFRGVAEGVCVCAAKHEGSAVHRAKQCWTTVGLVWADGLGVDGLEASGLGRGV